MMAAYRASAEDKLLDHLGTVAAEAHEKGEIIQATELYEHLVVGRRERNGNRDPRTLHALGGLSAVLRDRGEILARAQSTEAADQIFNIAEMLAREAADTTEQLLGAMHPDAERTQSQLRDVLLARGSTQQQ